MPVNMTKIHKEIPSTSGVYFFKDVSGNILYIGKAGNLKARLQSYFVSSRDIGLAKERMLKEATSVSWREAKSEIEALIWEAELIKKHAPRYNVLMRDDKNYTFVGFSKEPFPRIVVTHQPIKKVRSKNQESRINAKTRKHEVEYVGPFTEGTFIKYILRSLRRAFPYCTCKELHNRRCQNAAIGLCAEICCLKTKIIPEFLHAHKEKTLAESTREYRRNVSTIRDILSGKRKHILKKLRKEMEATSKTYNFEVAAEKRNQIWALERIFEHSPYIKKEWAVENKKGLKELEQLLQLTGPITRIEGYDISNIYGQDAVGSMVVFIDGIPDKNEYRKFKIKTIKGANDPAMINEILSRRFYNTAWQLPEAMLIDGGKTQLHAALAAKGAFVITARKTLTPEMRKRIESLPIVSIAKREEELYIPQRPEPIPLNSMPASILHLIQQVRDEAHRFAVSYHRKLHSRSTKDPHGNERPVLPTRRTRK